MGSSFLRRSRRRGSRLLLFRGGGGRLLGERGGARVGGFVGGLRANLKAMTGCFGEGIGRSLF